MNKLEKPPVVLSVALILLISIAFWNGEKKAAPALTADAALNRARDLQGEEYAFLSGIESDRGVHIVSPRHGSFALGDRIRLEIGGCSLTEPAFAVGINDQLATLQTWENSPYQGQYHTIITLPYKGLHKISISGSCGASKTSRNLLIVVDNSEHSHVDIAKSVVESFISQHPWNKLGWGWAESVFLNGLLQLSTVASQTDSEKYLHYVREYHFRHNGFRQNKFNWADPCAPAWSAWYLHKITGDTIGFDNLAKVLNYVRNEQPNALGAFNHLGSAVIGYFAIFLGIDRRSIWGDTLAMLITGMTIYGLDNNDDELLEFALAQPGIYQQYLQSTSGAYLHSWNIPGNGPMPSGNVPWLRGNGWIAANLVDMMEAIASASITKEKFQSRYQEYSVILRSQIEGLKSQQLDSGLWDTVVESPGYAYAETSGTALVGYAIAKGVNLGVLPTEDIEVAQRAFAGIAALLVPDGMGNHILTETSVGTNPSTAYKYSRVGRRNNVPYGVGAFAMLATELAKYKG